ncbi:LacI family DNA-binding transcriptional regulator [Natronohydrobacter thiooxidans]|uniref:LacI family DNA-binding transcriptional regulator n=1 Tax=Natronohydrobacter thiooxidans TaxID=87172 RepID=UPI0008FF43D0|nr:LacI family DNA-binding transcriptional regulator [Natronohydrobacter thiooxidans]
MTGKRVRMEDLAERCGVSVATVSRVLSDQPGVREDVRARVRAAAAALGYVGQSALAGRRAILIASRAALVDAARSQFTLHVLDGLRERAAALGMRLDVRAMAANFAETFHEDDDAAGYLLLTPENDTQIAIAADQGRPVILVNADDPRMRLSSVAPCNRTAAALATDHLIARGHRRILFLTCPGRRTIERRREGWAGQLAEAGLQADLVEEVADWRPDLAAEAIRARLSKGPRDFTAVLAAGDSLAIGALIGLAEAGVSVPDQVSVMGFDGLPQCDLQSPPLSAIEIPMQAIGATALDLLRDALTFPDAPPRRVELACRIIERASTGTCKE